MAAVLKTARARKRPRGFESHALRKVVVGANNTRLAVYTRMKAVYTRPMGKHLIDLDEPALGAARAELGTVTIKDTVNEALRRTARGRHERVARALDALAKANFDDREDAWR